MMRILVGCGIALAVIVAVLLTRSSPPSGGEGATSTQSSVTGTSAAAQGGGESGPGEAPLAPSVPAPIRMTSNRPQAAAVSPEAAQLSLAEAFAAEARAPALAKERRQMIRGVVEDLVERGVGSAHIEELDCRTRHCLLRVAGGNDRGVVALVDALQDERGFLGKAESMMLGRDEDAIRVYLRFPER